MKLKDYYLNSGILQTQIVENCVDTIRTADWTKINSLDENTKKKAFLEIDNIVTSLHTAYNKALSDFTTALKFKNPDKNVYLQRAYLNSADKIWSSKYEINLKLQLTSKMPENYFLAIRDYENYFGIFNSFDRINKRTFSEFNHALMLLKCKYLVRNKRFDYDLKHLHMNSTLRSDHELNWKIMNQFGQMDQNNSSLKVLYNEISELIELFPEKMEAIIFRYEIVNNEVDNFISQNEFILNNYKWIEKNTYHKVNSKPIFGASMITQAINDIDFILKINPEHKNISHLLYRKGLFNYLIGSFEEANNDYSKSIKITNVNHIPYLKYVENTIRDIRYQRDQDYQNNTNWISNECACGESPCCCSDRDN